MPSDYRSSDVHSWFASVQREIWDGALLDLAYVGNRANGMLLFANYNQAAPNNAAGTLSLQSRRPIPEYADITYSFNGGKSRYHSFQTKFDWRIGRDMTLLSSLTLSQTKDNGAGSLENPNGNFPAPQDFRNLDADYGLSAYHQPYNSTTSFVIDLPFGRGRRYMTNANAVVDAILGGWMVAGINTRRAGRDGDADLHADRGAAGVGHSAGLPRRQQLSPERQRRSAGAGRRAQHQQLVEPHHGDGADRSEPAVRQRGAQQRARPAAVAVDMVMSKRFDMPWRATAASSSAASLQPAEPHELPRAERQPQRRRLRHDHDDVRSADHAVRVQGELLTLHDGHGGARRHGAILTQRSR